MNIIQHPHVFAPHQRQGRAGLVVFLFVLAACFSLPAAAQGDAAQSGQEAASDAHEDTTSSTAQDAAEAAAQDLETLAQADTTQTNTAPPPPENSQQNQEDIADSETLSEEEAAEVAELLEEDEDAVEEIIVTGSRLKRDAFQSVSPMQIISGDLSREAGLFDTTEILQSTAQVNSLQVNNSFNTFVLDNGLGATTIGYRGLGARRTLVLINGRRLGAAGVGAAPSSADLNLIPAVLIDRVENLFDGASSVYGSDAVAGVANIILRSDVDGIEFRVSGAHPETGGGKEHTFTVLTGKTGDNWNFTAALEHHKETTYRFGDSKFFNACDEYRYEDENGNLLTRYRGLAPGTTESNCRLDTVNRALIRDGIFGNVWSTPGETNIGIPGWSETVIGDRLAPFAPAGTVTQIDINGDGELDDSFLVDPDQNGRSEIDLQSGFYNYAVSERAQRATLFAGLKRVSAYGLGSYNFEDANNTEAYFEGMYVRRESSSFSPGPILFPDVPPTNPFNITNPAGLGVNSLNFFNVDFGAFEVTPLVPVRGDRDFDQATIEQYRLVGGVRGNIGFLDDFLEGNWSYDAYINYSRAEGKQWESGVNGDRLALSLETTIEDPNNPGSYICGEDADGDGVPDGTDGCVPVNMFAPSLYQAGGGAFASQAEADYLFAESRFNTTIEQTILSGVVQGDVFTLPNGSAVPLLLGYEFRRDSIDSIPNDIAANGTLFARFSDRGAVGTRYLHELFGETSLELFKDAPYAEEVVVDLSGRVTDDDNFKPNWTYSGKLLYRPVSWFTLRGTYGTSYRAPNARERFLIGTSGFLSVTDPCVVPAGARESENVRIPNAPERYTPDTDRRSERLLNICRAQGLDPTSLGLETGAGDGFLNRTSVEVIRSGAENLAPETSTSYTFGFVAEQPFTDKFDLKFSASYFDIDIKQGIVTPSVSFIFADCYANPDLPQGTLSGFCGRIIRDTDNSLKDVDASYLNASEQRSRGVDLDLNYIQDFELGDERLRVEVDMNATWAREQFLQLLGTSDNDVGEPSSPRWRADARLIMAYREFRFNWFTRWIKGGQLHEDEFVEDDVPCDGLPVSCRPIYYTTNYAVHNTGLAYRWRNYVLNVGVRNVFNTKPPEVDDDGVFGYKNVPLGVGHDLIGRTFFGTLIAEF